MGVVSVSAPVVLCFSVQGVWCVSVRGVCVVCVVCVHDNRRTCDLRPTAYRSRQLVYEERRSSASSTVSYRDELLRAKTTAFTTDFGRLLRPIFP